MHLHYRGLKDLGLHNGAYNFLENKRKLSHRLPLSDFYSLITRRTLTTNEIIYHRTRSSKCSHLDIPAEIIHLGLNIKADPSADQLTYGLR